MPSRHSRNRVAARHDLRDDPRLVLITKRTPTARAGETRRRAGSVITLCTVSILSLAVEPNRRLADHGTIWKVSAEHRLLFTVRFAALIIVFSGCGTWAPADDDLPPPVLPSLPPASASPPAFNNTHHP